MWELDLMNLVSPFQLRISHDSKNCNFPLCYFHWEMLSQLLSNFPLKCVGITKGLLTSLMRKTVAYSCCSLFFWVSNINIWDFLLPLVSSVSCLIVFKYIHLAKHG